MTTMNRLTMNRLRRPLTVAAALTAALGLASCGQTGSAVAPTTAPTATTGAATTPATTATTSDATTPASPSTPTPAGRRIDVTVKGKQVQPRPATVDIAVGESLTITVTSDHDNTLHAHGFDIEKATKAGQRLEITVKGAEPGVFDFELHDPELRLFQVAVR